MQKVGVKHFFSEAARDLKFKLFCDEPTHPLNCEKMPLHIEIFDDNVKNATCDWRESYMH